MCFISLSYIEAKTVSSKNMLGTPPTSVVLVDPVVLERCEKSLIDVNVNYQGRLSGVAKM